MAITGGALAEAIIEKFPPTWNHSNPAAYNRRWLDALCQGFQTMWNSGVMTSGTGPPPSGTYLHTHTLVSLNSSLMAAPVRQLWAGKDGLTFVFADIITANVASFLVANTQMQVVDGNVLHVHPFTSFGAADALSSQLLSALAATGRFNVGASVMPQWFTAFASGLLEYLLASAETFQAVGNGHVHALL